MSQSETTGASVWIHLRVAIAALLITGCATAAPDPGSTGPGSVTWRVVTYNIHAGRGMDDRTDLERTASVIRRLDPDVVALQEVDDRVARSNRVDQAARLGALLGMNHAFGSFMDYQGGRYGVAVLSRCSIRSIEPVRLTEGNEPRIALAVELVQPDSTVMTVVDVHFDWVGDDTFRFTQAGETAQFLDQIDGPYILAGDFNDEPGSRTLDLFHARAKEAAKPRNDRFTFSSTEPRKEIDFIFVAPGEEWEVESADVVHENMASDHLPVVAELEQRVVGSMAGGRRGCG